MPNDSPNDRLIWIDLEMTGLDTDRDGILEIATVVTDGQLNLLAEGPEFAIAHPVSVLEAMDDWNRNQHGKSGLWRRVLEEGVPLAEAEARTLLTGAFCREVMTRIEDAAVRDPCEAALNAALAKLGA